MQNNSYKRFAYAIRIWNKNGYMPMADILLGKDGKPSGEIETIQWDNINERSKYVINAYTFIFDERLKGLYKSFSDYASQNSLHERNIKD